MILTSNKSHGDGGTIFADNVIAAAILARFSHHSTTINIKGESYRLPTEERKLLTSPATASASVGNLSRQKTGILHLAITQAGQW